MTATITRWECPECGRHVFAPDLPHGRTVNEAQVTGRTCPGVPVERTYVAVDALREWAGPEQLPDYEGPTTNGDRLVVDAAITAVTGEQA